MHFDGVRCVCHSVLFVCAHHRVDELVVVVALALTRSEFQLVTHPLLLFAPAR
jgi:hypothetical protein